MSLEQHLKLAQADSRIQEAEANIRHVESMLPWFSSQGYATGEIQSQLGLMSEALHHPVSYTHLTLPTKA